MHVSPEMLKDYLLRYFETVTVSGNTRLRFLDARLPDKTKKYDPDYIYLMTAEEWEKSDGRMSALIMSKTAEPPPDSGFCLIAAPGDPNDLLNKALDCFSEYTEWFEDLYKSIAIGDSAEAILEKCTPVLKNPCFIDDSSYRTLARLKLSDRRIQ